MGTRIFLTVILTILSFYWLPTAGALVAMAIVLLLVLRTPARRAVERGRRIIAARGKHDDMIADLYWKESMVYALFLGVAAGGMLSGESAQAGYGGDAGGVDLGGGSYDSGFSGGGDFGGSAGGS